MYIQSFTQVKSLIGGTVQRKGKLINIWLSEQQKTKLDWLAERTHVSRSELVRQALDLLFDKAAGGQLSLGFSIVESKH